DRARRTGAGRARGRGAVPTARAGHRPAPHATRAGPRETGRASLAHTPHGAHHVRASENESSLPWLDRAIAMGGEVGDHEVVSRALSNKGVAVWFLGQHEAGVELVQESLRIALAHDLEDLASRNYQTLASLAWIEFDLREAHALFEQPELASA